MASMGDGCCGLHPAARAHPSRAVVYVVLIGVLTHTALYVPHLALFNLNGIMMLLVGGLLCGLRMSMLLVKRNFEHAVGYHFLIDLFVLPHRCGKTVIKTARGSLQSRALFFPFLYRDG